MSLKPFFAAVFVAILSITQQSPDLAAENWPQWRGPAGNGISPEQNLPVKWNREENVAWRLPLPGPAGSTPVVWGDRIFLTSVDAKGDLLLICISTAGNELWRQTMDTGNTDVRGDEGNSASNSPCTDGKHVWAMMASGALGCYTMDGKEIWKFNVADRYGKLSIQFGLTSSPLLDKGRLYLQLIHGEGKAETQEAAVVCLDAATGDEVWKQARVTGASQENEHAYSSPTLYRDGQQEFLITHGGDFAIAHRLSDGVELWRYGLNPQGASYHPTLRFVASPLAADGFVIVPSAKNGPLVALRPGAKGEIEEQGNDVLWRHEKGTPDVPSPIADGGLVYLCRENGILVCVDAKTGKQIYEERLVSDRHRASPILAGGYLYLTARKGTVSVVRAGPKFEMVAQNELGEPTSSSPVVANGRLYLRTFDALYAIGR
jgi:outer membrane protein assembly factor BamB